MNEIGVRGLRSKPKVTLIEIIQNDMQKIGLTPWVSLIRNE